MLSWLLQLRQDETCKKQSEEIVRLTAQNLQLIGHQNPKQKIQLHMNIKKENDQLKHEKSALEKQISRYVLLLFRWSTRC